MPKSSLPGERWAGSEHGPAATSGDRNRPSLPATPPPKNPFTGWMTGGFALFIVGAVVAIVCFANSGGTETRGSGWSRTSVDIVYMDMLAAAVSSVVVAAAGLIVAAVAKVGSEMYKERQRHRP